MSIITAHERNEIVGVAGRFTRLDLAREGGWVTRPVYQDRGVATATESRSVEATRLVEGHRTPGDSGEDTKSAALTRPALEDNWTR